MKSTAEVDLWECDSAQCQTRYISKGERPEGFHFQLVKVTREYERGKPIERAEQYEAWCCTKACLERVVQFGLSRVRNEASVSG